MLNIIAISTFFCAITMSEAFVDRCYFNAGGPNDGAFQECRPQSGTPSCFTFTCPTSSKVLKGCNDPTDPAFNCAVLKQQCGSNGNCQVCESNLCNGSGSTRLSLLSALVVPAIAALIAKLS